MSERSTKTRSRVLRWAAVAGVVLCVLLGSAYAVLRIALNGAPLANKIAETLNKTMRGRIAVGSVEWDPSALKTVVTGGWVPITLRDVTIWDDCALTGGASAEELRKGDPNRDCTLDEHPDPDPTSKRKPRKVLARVPLVTAEADIHAFLFGNHDVVFRHVWVHGGEALLEQVDEPYPLTAYDRTIVSIITAFYPREKAGFRAGLYADSAPPVVDLLDVHIEHLNLTVHMSPLDDGPGRVVYSTTARLEDVNVDAGPTFTNDNYLHMDARDPLVAKFYVRLAVTAPRGTVRANDAGPLAAFRIPTAEEMEKPVSWPPPGRTADYQFTLADVKLNRLAQLPGDWARRDYVANTLELDLQARTVTCAANTPGVSPAVLEAPVLDPKDPKLGAELHITGQLHDYWDRPYDGAWDLALEASNLGPTVRTCVMPIVGGTELGARITLTGPFVASPAIGLDLKNLDVDVPLQAGQPPLPLTLAEVHGRIDMVNEQGYIDQTKALVRGGQDPGEVHLSATFALAPFNANAHIEIAKAIDMQRFLPPSIVGPLGHYLHGRLDAKGDVAEGFAVENFDLALGTTPDETTARLHKGRIFTPDRFDTVKIEDVRADMGKTHATVTGFFDLVNNRMHLEGEGEAPDLKLWLTRFGLPAFAESAGGGGTHFVIDGKITDPVIEISTELAGVPCLDKVRIASARLSGTTLDGKFSSGAFGGTLDGTVRLDTASSRIEKLTVTGSKLDAARICGSGGRVRGTIDKVDLAMANTVIDPDRAPIEWLSSVELYAQAKKLAIHTDTYEDTYTGIGVCLNRADDKACRPRPQYLDGDDLDQCAKGRKSGNGFCAVATATREAGGILDATVSRVGGSGRGKTAVPEKLGGTVSLHDLPLFALGPKVAGTAGGIASVTLHLQGTTTAPQAVGAVDLLRAWVKDSFLGDAQLAVEPAMVGTQPGLAIHGTALAGRLRVVGTIGTAAPYPVELAVSGHRIEADAFVDLQTMLGMSEPIQAWASGTITVKTELLPAKPVVPEAWIELSELEGIVDHRAPDGRHKPLRVRLLTPSDRPASTAASLRVTPTTVELACRNPKAAAGRQICTTRLETPAGIVDVRGQVTPSSIAIKASGVLDLGLVAPLVDDKLDTLEGQAKLEASLQGTLDNPVWEASLELKDVVARPVGGETVLTAPSGLIKIANGSLGFTDVKVLVRDQNRDEAGELHVKGNIGLAGLTPTTWGVLVSGTVAGKMLLVAAPDQIAQASGLARIEGDLLLTGKGERPTVSGTVVFDPPPKCAAGATEAEDGSQCLGPKDVWRPLAIIPRGVRRELSFEAGSLDIETEAGATSRLRIDVDGVRASIDGEGALTNISGAVEVVGGVPTDVELSLGADKIPFRIPGTLDVVLGARNVTLAKHGSAPPVLRGQLEVDGTFRREFSFANQITALGATTPPTIPFWETYPTLGATDLGLTVEVRRFAVINNIAELYFSGTRIAITGTPRDPRISGQIDVTRGTFRPPGTKARFDQTTGHINFLANERAGNPQLDVSSNANFRDTAGQDHLITLTIGGPLDNLGWDLKTAEGYDKSQTISLLLLGRSPEQLRRTLGDQTIGNDPTRIDPTTNPSQGFADQIVKDLAGDWVVGKLGDQIGRVTGLDVFNLQVGFNSIGLHIEKNIVQNLKLLGDGEQSFFGNTINVRVELDTPSRVKFQAGYLGKNYDDPAEPDYRDLSGSVKKQFKLFVP